MSEFGSGYATCLRQFVNHRARLAETLDTYARMRADGHDDLFRPLDAVHIWANGASDHLYELTRPPRGVTRADWARAVGLRDRAIDIGHGFRASSENDPDEAVRLLDEADYLLALLSDLGHAVGSLENALETDRSLGLLPDKGRWNCAADLRRADKAVQV